MQKSLVGAVVWIVLAIQCFGEKALPADESRNVPHFPEFRRRLFSAVKSRDADYIYSIVSPNGEFSFGGNGRGLAGFKAHNSLGNRNAVFWLEMEKLLPYGGAWDQARNTVWFPFFYSRGLPGGPGRGVDPRAVVMGSDVLVRSSPSKSSAAIDSLSYEIVNLREWEGDWARITYSDDSKSGWMNGRYLASPFGYRSGFKLEDGRWKLDSFVRGD